MNVTPKLAHWWKNRSNFLYSAALWAKLDLVAAFEIKLSCSGEIMVTHGAAGYRADQQGKLSLVFLLANWREVGSAATGQNFVP